jgi:hypothetical protein
MRTLLALLAVAACNGSSSHSCPDGGTCGTSGDAPKILTMSTNVMTLDEHGTLAITVVVTDPQGIDDVIGGTLVDPMSGASYGAFATSAAEGAYELKLAWGELNAVRAIDTPAAGAKRDLLARFFDQAGHSAEETTSVLLHCSITGDGTCEGMCTDLANDPQNCGMCGVKVADGQQCKNGHPTCASGPENTVAACSDGCDNDGDTYIDCNDFNCCTLVTCAKGTACNP